MSAAARRTAALAGALMAVLAAWPVGSAMAAITPLSELGSGGTGAGQFSNPEGIAIDASGRIYVADVSSNRISVFEADGTFIHAFGRGVRTGGSSFEVCTTTTGCLPGLSGSGAAGELNGPRGIALDGAGNLYVSEDDGPRISVFDTSGPSFVRSFGWGVLNGMSVFQTCTTGTGCMSGISGDGAGQLSYSHDVLPDGAGNLYVTDPGNHRVNVYGTAGPSFVHSFGYDVAGGGMFEDCTSSCQTGLAGAAAGQLNSPKGLALSDSGMLYVSDANQRISVFDTSGPSFVHAFGQGVATGGPGFEVCTSPCQIGAAASGAGALNQPKGMVLDGSDQLLVAEVSNNRISYFSTTGTPSFALAFGFGVDTGANAFETCTTLSGCQLGTSTTAGGLPYAPHYVVTDVCGNVWVSDQNKHIDRYGEPGTLLPPTCMAPVSPPVTKCGGRTATKVGTAGRDHLRGTKAADVIAALGGRDIVSGLAGNDVICGGGGRDSLFGGPGRDRLLGQAGRDTCNGGPKHDTARTCEVRKRV